jgi:nucleoid-associated protein YejK
MIDFDSTTFLRVAIHTIVQKEELETATVDFATELVDLSSSVENVIKKRLADSCGARSSAFILDIANSSPESFFSLATQLRQSDDSVFITLSQQIALRLAQSQRRSNIAGGALLVIDAEDDERMPVAIVIKAEPQVAITSQRNVLEVVERIIMSSADKLYKIAAIYREDTPDAVPPNDTHSCILFDLQFKNGQSSRPAEYFWSDFLGFSIDNNSKIQSKRFFNETFQFIQKNYSTDIDTQTTLIESLESYYTHRQSDVIDPREFGTDYIDPDHLVEYERKVIPLFPHPFPKNTALLDNRLKKDDMYFTHNIHLSGPKEVFDDNVSIITAPDEISALDLEGYTILKIKGKPRKYKEPKARSNYKYTPQNTSKNELD